MTALRAPLAAAILLLAGCAMPPPPAAPAPHRVQIAARHQRHRRPPDQTIYIIDDELGRVSVILDHARVTVERRLDASTP